MNNGMQSPRTLVERGGYTALPNAESDRNGGSLPVPQMVRQETAGDMQDVIQFSSAIYIVNVDEGKLSADIMRIGKMEESVSFKFSTQSSSAVAGKQFEHTEGSITLAPKEDSAVIEVPILNSARWSPTTEFLITLHSSSGCTLGLYLKVARVKVLDSSIFPLDDFREQMATDEGIETINKFHLFAGFVFQMWEQDGMKWRTIVTIILDQLHNIYTYLRLVLAIYMVDTVFNMEKEKEKELYIPGNRLATCYVVAALIVCPMFILYAADLIKVAMDIPGRLQRDLSRNLFRKFMNYNKQSREDVPCPDMVTSLTQDAATCSGGYISVLGMVRVLGKLTISIYFTLSQNPSAWWACVLVPVLMAFWGKRRTNAYINASEVKGDTESRVVAFVNEALNKMGLIADYAQRPQMNEMFAAKSEELRGAQIPEHLVVKNNMFFPELLGPALIALYTAIGGSLVLEGELRIGVYLATISVFGDICDSFHSLFRQVMEVISTFAPLKGLTVVLNKATDVPALKKVNRGRRAMTKDFRAELLANPPPRDAPFVPAADRMDIKLLDMGFGHPGLDHIFRDTNYSAKQGSITAIIGQPGVGRRTLLELVAHKMFPDEGSLFIPSHCRILFVSAESVLMNLSLWQNLTFGNSKGNDPFRVERILQELRMYECLEIIKKDLTQRKKDTGAHGDDEEEEPEEETARGNNPLDKMRGSQKANIHLARALIMNPEVLVCHRPFANYPKAGDDESAERVQAIFVAHVKNRGFQLDPATVATRRPRTLFFTPDTAEEAQMADTCWVLPNSVGGKCVEDMPGNVWPATTSTATAGHHAHTFVNAADSPKGKPPGQIMDTQRVEEQAPSRPLDQMDSRSLADPPSSAKLREEAAEAAAKVREQTNGKRRERDQALQQELMALGPRPMSAMGLGQILEQAPQPQPPSYRGSYDNYESPNQFVHPDAQQEPPGSYPGVRDGMAQPEPTSHAPSSAPYHNSRPPDKDGRCCGAR